MKSAPQTTTHKLQLDIHDSVKGELDRIKEVAGLSSYKEVFVHALALLSWVIAVKQEGKSIIAIDTHGEKVQLVAPYFTNIRKISDTASQEKEESSLESAAFASHT